MCRQAKYLPSGMFYYRTGYTSVWYDLHLYILSRKDHNGHIRIMIFWPFEGLKRNFDIKYEVKYHKTVHNFTQGLRSPSCHRVKICYRITLQVNPTICLLLSIIYSKWIWTISWYLTSYLTSQSSLTLQKVKWIEFQHYHSDSRVKLFDHANV